MLKSNKMIDKIFLEYSQQSHKSYNFFKTMDENHP